MAVFCGVIQPRRARSLCILPKVELRELVENPFLLSLLDLFKILVLKYEMLKFYLSVAVLPVSSNVCDFVHFSFLLSFLLDTAYNVIVMCIYR